MIIKLTPLAICLSGIMMLGLSGCVFDDKPPNIIDTPTDENGNNDGDCENNDGECVDQTEILVINIDSHSTAKTFETLTLTANARGLNDTNKVSYSWDFGDDSSDTGKSTSHIYGISGVYTVTLTARDSNTNKTVTTTAQVTISPLASSNVAPVLVGVTASDNRKLSNVKVMVDGKSTVISETGFAVADAVNTMEKTLVKVSAKGYINQSIQLSPNMSTYSRTVSVKLKAQEPTQNITDISMINTINYNGMTVKFDNDSFVTADGTKATGTAGVSITQWNPTNEQDMSAFLGNGLAIDNQGNYTQLVSYGAMTVELTQNGQKLQLAPGKYATISMPLSLDKHYDDVEIKAGDTIPMWHFSGNTGAWMQEDDLIGTVTDANDELVLEAKVSHFSTWNWDRNNAIEYANLDMNCNLANNISTPTNNVTLDECKVAMRVTYLDHSGATVHNNIAISSKDNKIPFDVTKGKVTNIDFYEFYAYTTINSNGSIKSESMSCKFTKKPFDIPATGVANIDLDIEVDSVTPDIKLVRSGVLLDDYSCHVMF